MRVIGALIVFTACGGDDPAAAPDAPGPCTPAPGPLPTVGRFRDPLAFELAGCVSGGLRDLPGRWFVRNPDSMFSFDYPKYEGDCTSGFRRAFTEDDLDGSDGSSRFTWSDGTRFFRHSYRVSERDPEPPFERESADVLCVRSDGTLGGTRAFFNTDQGESRSAILGTQFGRLDEPARGLTLVGELGVFGPNPEDRVVGLNVVVEGTLAYVVGFAGLSIIDVSNPTAPMLISHWQDGGGLNDVRVVRGGGRIVAFASPLADAVTFVVDVTDPAQPIGLEPLPEFSHSVQVARGATTRLYLASYGDSVPVYDVTNPAVPARLGAVPIAGDPSGVHDLTVDGDRLYVNYLERGLVALRPDSGFDSATELGRLQTSFSHAGAVTTTSSGRKILLHGDEGMTGTADGGAFLRILDNDPTSPTYLTELARYRTRKEVGIHNIEAIGDRVYLSYYQDGVRIIDIADPTQPRAVAHFNTWDPETALGGSFEGAVGIRIANGHIFVADLDRGLIILRE